MCWSREISGVFTLFQFAVAGYVYWAKKSRRYKAYAFITAFFGSMEALQFLTWFFIEPYSTLTSGAKTCSTGNKVITLLSYMHIWLQPVAFCYFSKLLARGERKLLFVIPLAIALVTFCNALIAYYLGAVHGVGLQDDFPHGHRDFYNCSYEGPHGHILWRFTMAIYDTIPYALPNCYSYSIMSIVFLWIRPVHVMAMTVFCFWGLSNIAKFMVDFSLESSAYWCFTTVIIAVFVLLEPVTEGLIGYKDEEPWDPAKEAQEEATPRISEKKIKGQ